MPFCNKIIKKLDSAVNFMVLVLFLAMFAYGCYAQWDTKQIYQGAQSTQYEVYKPTAENTLSFDELKKLNPEVFGWLTVYGTKIDYPLVQGENNEKYVNTDAKGKYSMAGSLFLDYRNKQDFTDFNQIVYGHHMEEEAMFGDLEKFLARDFFMTHQYGNLFANGKNYGLEFFALLRIDAYDTVLYQPAVREEKRQRSYLDKIFSLAEHQRQIGVTEEDSIILLSTCTSDVTNGREVLAARITDKTWPDPFGGESGESNEDHSRWWLTLLGVVPLLLLLVVLLYRRSKKKEGGRK